MTVPYEQFERRHAEWLHSVHPYLRDIEKCRECGQERPYPEGTYYEDRKIGDYIVVARMINTHRPHDEVTDDMRMLLSMGLGNWANHRAIENQMARVITYTAYEPRERSPYCSSMSLRNADGREYTDYGGRRQPRESDFESKYYSRAAPPMKRVMRKTKDLEFEHALKVFEEEQHNVVIPHCYELIRRAFPDVTFTEDMQDEWGRMIRPMGLVPTQFSFDFV